MNVAALPTTKVTKRGADHYIVLIKCHTCKEYHRIQVTTQDWFYYINGKDLVQNLFPYLNAGERELLITATCDTCFNRLFAELD